MVTEFAQTHVGTLMQPITRQITAQTKSIVK